MLKALIKLVNIIVYLIYDANVVKDFYLEIALNVNQTFNANECNNMLNSSLYLSLHLLKITDLWIIEKDGN